MSVTPSPIPQAGPARDYSVSVIRTVTALLVGLILGAVGSEIAGVNEETLTALVSVVVAGAYHALIRALEQKWPKLGVLLGWPAAPTYPKPPEGA